MTTTNSGKSEAKARLGRPRDGSIRMKVIPAAIECYADRGWSGFSFEAVSVIARVGRPALYRRWSGREELLIDAFRESAHGLRAPDRGNVRDDLTDVAVAFRQLMEGARGRAGIRLFVERDAAAEVFRAVSTEISAQRESLIMKALERGQARGEIRAGTDLHTASRLLLGALTSDSLARNRTPREIRSSVASTVETLLRGVGT